MKKLLIVVLAFVILVPPAIASDTHVPPPQGSPPEPSVPPRPVPPQADDATPFPQGMMPPIGQGWDAADTFAIDLDNLPVPEELADTGFVMDFDSEKRDLAEEWVRLLTEEQRARISQLLADSHTAAMGEVAAELAAAKESGRAVPQDAEKLEASLAELARWHSAMSAGLAEILTPEQYELYQNSLLPAPDVWMPAAPKSQSDCYGAYYWSYYGYQYAYYFYAYAYYTYVSSSDPYVYLTYDLAYNSYVHSYYGYVYSYNAYVYYYNSTYAYYAYYFMRHAEGFSYYGYQMAYILYTWTSNNSYSYYSYVHGYYAYYYITRADDYVWDCYSDVGSTIANGDFENGRDGSWTEYSPGGYDLITTAFPGSITPHSGSWAAWLGGEYDATTYVYQDVTVPSSNPALSYWYWIASADYCGYDYGYVRIDDTPIVTYALCGDNDTDGWAERTVSLSSFAGQTVKLEFRVTTDGALNSNFFVDDVSFTTSAQANQRTPFEVLPTYRDASNAMDRTSFERLGRYLPYPASETGKDPASAQKQPADLPVVGENRDAPYPERTVDLSALPLPDELTDTGFAMPFDSQKAQAGSEWVRSLTDEQRARIRAVLEVNRSPALERAAAVLAQAKGVASESSLDHEALDAAEAEVNRWQNAMSDGLAGILTPEQFELYQASLLPAPDTWQVMAPAEQNDCYLAYSNLYDYGNVYAYYHYLYVYYAYAYYSDPYLYDSYLFGYNDYLTSYYGWLYSYIAYIHHYDATYSYYAWYFTRHAEGFSYYGYPFAYMTYTWTTDSYSYNAYVYAYYAYYYIDIADVYARACYAQVMLQVPEIAQEQSNWCWAGTAQAIMSYHGTVTPQCTMANYTHGQSTCCLNPTSTSCDQGTTNSEQSTLYSHYGFDNTAISNYLSFGSVKNEINNDRPFKFGWHWTSDGGHAMAVRGYDGDNDYVYYMDPGYGEYKTATYSYCVSSSNHTWSTTIYNIHK